MTPTDPGDSDASGKLGGLDSFIKGMRKERGESSEPLEVVRSKSFSAQPRLPTQDKMSMASVETGDAIKERLEELVSSSSSDF